MFAASAQTARIGLGEDIFMKSILIISSIALLATTTVANAEYMDVIAMQMKPGCTLQQFTAVISDFNKWGAQPGYNAKLAVPLQDQDLTTAFFVGTTKNAATFGAAWDAWRDGQADANSTPAKLQARFNECVTNKTRSGYDVY
jgi:hypothetical protein